MSSKQLVVIVALSGDSITYEVDESKVNNDDLKSLLEYYGEDFDEDDILRSFLAFISPEVAKNLIFEQIKQKYVVKIALLSIDNNLDPDIVKGITVKDHDLPCIAHGEWS